MDERLRELQRRASSGDPDAKQEYIHHLIRIGRYDDLRDMIIDQSFFDLAAVSEQLMQHRKDININLTSQEDINVSEFLFSPPPPPPAVILQNNEPFDYISPLGQYGEIPFSEAAMHAQASGLNVTRYFLRQREYQPGKQTLSYAYVQTEPWPRVRLAHGTIGEVLPDQVRRDLGGFGNEKLPEDMGERFIEVRAEVRTDTAWGTPARMRIAQMQLYYYPSLNENYWRVSYADSESWDELVSMAIQVALPAFIRAPIA